MNNQDLNNIVHDITSELISVDIFDDTTEKEYEQTFETIQKVMLKHMDCGLTKREYFAAMAMQALIISDSLDNLTERDVARLSIKQAELLIEELNKC